MEDYIAKTVQAYDDVKIYEDSTKLVIPKIDLDNFLALLPPGALILDAGCAYGRDMVYIKSKGYRAKGIDLSPALIARAKVLQPNESFAVKDVRDTGFDDATFDGIWCRATLLHLNDEDIDRALREFYRILRPGGALEVSFKKGTGTQRVVEKSTSNAERFFNFKTKEAFHEQLIKARFEERAADYVNERERFGPDTRDLDWLNVVAIKPISAT
jgi:SAM-dependent methyltransferase